MQGVAFPVVSKWCQLVIVNLKINAHLKKLSEANHISDALSGCVLLRLQHGCITVYSEHYEP